MTENKNGWAIILAAGASSRFGSAKALAPWQGGTLLSKILDTANQVFDDRIICVTGGYAAQIQSHLSGTHFVFNENWQDGLGGSISAGINEVLKSCPDAPFVSLIPVDQPFITAVHLENLIEKARATEKCVLTQGGNIFGPPATIPCNFFHLLLQNKGDKGLKSVLQAAITVAVPGYNILLDIDTREDLENLKTIYQV